MVELGEFPQSDTPAQPGRSMHQLVSKKQRCHVQPSNVIIYLITPTDPFCPGKLTANFDGDYYFFVSSATKVTDASPTVEDSINNLKRISNSLEALN